MNTFIYSKSEKAESLSQGEYISFAKHTTQMEWQLRKLDHQIQGQQVVGKVIAQLSINLLTFRRGKAFGYKDYSAIPEVSIAISRFMWGSSPLWKLFKVEVTLAYP